MKNVFGKLKDKLVGSTDADYDDYEDEEYLEIDTERESPAGSKITIKPFTIEDFSDVKPALDALREGMTIALINIRPIKERDIVELKRAVNKLKKTCDAIEGDIAGFGDDWIVVTPNFAKIYRSPDTEEVEE